MNNLPKIKKLSRLFSLLILVMFIAIPLFDILYWVFLNDLPSTIFSDTDPVALSNNHIPATLRLIGFAVSLLPFSALIYGLMHIRKLFLLYGEGSVFSFAHVRIFKKTANALIYWVVLSILYESTKSVLFSLGNPPGERLLTVSFSSSEFTMLFIAGIIYVIAWVMDEGRIIAEEQSLTV